MLYFGTLQLSTKPMSGFKAQAWFRFPPLLLNYPPKDICITRASDSFQESTYFLVAKI